MTTKKKKGLLYHLARDTDLYIMLLPAMVLVFIFSYMPIFGIVLAFKEYDILQGIWGSPWVGLKYFQQFFNDPYFFRITKNTILLSFFGILFGFPAPIILALFLNELKALRFKRIIQSISYLPHFVSTVVIVGIMMYMFDAYGIVNDILRFIGIPEQVFFSDSKWFRTLYIGSGIWQGIGWDAIIYLAAIAGINPELYEAAVLDGANRWQNMWHITLTSIMSVVRILLILEIGGLFGIGFEKVYLMYNPGIYDVADVVSTYVYRRGIIGMDFSYSAAVGLFNSIVNFTLIFIANYISRKISDEGLW